MGVGVGAVGRELDRRGTSRRGETLACPLNQFRWPPNQPQNWGFIDDKLMTRLGGVERGRRQAGQRGRR
jgi:hypothetical protein